MRAGLGAAALLLAVAGDGCHRRGTDVSVPASGPAAVPPFDHVIVAHIPGDRPVGMQDPSPRGIAVGGGVIAEIAEPAALVARCVDPCRVHELSGFVVPGFHDAHSHPYKGGALAYRVRVEGASVPAIVAKVEAWAAAHPDAAWVVGRGWDAAEFEGRPHRTQLDDADVGGRPIALTDSDGHAVWVNTAALSALRVGAQTPDPPGGTIVRDQAGPTGLFLEGARELVYAGIEVTDQDLDQYLLEGQQVLLENGFTSWQGGPVDLQTARAYRRLDERGAIVLHTHLWADLRADDEAFAQWLDFGEALPDDGRVHLSAFKGFVDGVFSTHSAALLQPYSDDPKSRGELRIDPERLNALVLRANRAGYRVALHAIGARAVRVALDAFEHSKQKLAHALVNSVEHIESMHPADAKRFAQLGVAASLQPTHFAFTRSEDSYYEARLGPQRLEHTFPWRELVQAEALVAFGTDYPVVPADPIAGIRAAVHRKHPDGTPFTPHQAIEPSAALAAFTVAPAEVIGAEHRGRLVQGHVADLVVLQHDPLKAQVEHARGQVMLVMVEGEVVYRP